MPQLLARLDSLDPRLAPTLLALFVGALVYAWRRFAPASFEKIPPQYQAVPAIVVGGLLGGTLGSGDAVKMIVDASFGAIAGLVAIGGHHVLKAAPDRLLGMPFIPYKGGPISGNTRKDSLPPSLRAASLLFAFAVFGCGPSQPVKSADDVGAILDKVGPAIVFAQTLERGKCVTDNATRDQAEGCIKLVDDRYAPIYDAYNKAVTLYQAGANAIEAYCGVRVVFPEAPRGPCP